MGCQSYSLMVRKLKIAMGLEERTSGKSTVDLQVMLTKRDPSGGADSEMSAPKPTHFIQAVSDLHLLRQTMKLTGAAPSSSSTSHTVWGKGFSIMSQSTISEDGGTFQKSQFLDAGLEPPL